jgi:predicted ArsR family transcriptional regulator
MNTLDALLHQPLRTQLVAFLAGAGEVTFSELKQKLEVSDGNLDSHLKKLIAADYIAVRKESGQGRPQTFYELTVTGKAALRDYVLALRGMLPMNGQEHNALEDDGLNYGHL